MNPENQSNKLASVKSICIGLPIASVIIIYAARMWELGTKRSTIPGSVPEKLTLRLFILAGTVMLVSIVAEFFWRGESLRWATFLAGWGCALVSFRIRRQAMAALGPYWSLHVEIREHHPLIKAGPFRWMRHPTYFSMLLELVSGGLLLNAFYSLLIIPVLFVPVLLARLKLEEAALVDKFGEAYRAYQRTTPALFHKWPPSR